MKKHKWIIFFIFGFLFLLILLIGYGYITEGKTGEKPVNISVLVYGNDTERWTTLRQGAVQIEKDLNVVINYVATSTESSPEEQIEQINREIDNGARGLMIAASDSTKLEETVAELVEKIPIVMIETGVNNVETIEYLSADNYSMGKTLAETLMKVQSTKKDVAVVSENMQRDSVVMRSRGFTETIEGFDIVSWKCSNNLLDLTKLKSMLINSRVDTVVALDNSTLENLVDVIEEAKLDITVYGIGNTDKVIYYLDKGMIHSIVYQDEFSIGYLGAKKLYEAISNRSDETYPGIAFRVIDKKTMYSKENQRLLFPLVQ